MDLGELVINIQVKVEDAEDSLQKAVQTMQKFATEIETAMSKALPPDILAGASNALEGIAEGFPAVTAGVNSIAGAFTGLISVMGGAKKAMAAFKTLSSASMGWMGVVAGAVGIAAGVYGLPVSVGDVMDKVIEIQRSKLGESAGLFKQWAGDYFDLMLTQLAQKEISIPPELSDALRSALMEVFSPEQLAAFGDLDAVETAMRDSLDKIAVAMQDSNVQDAVAGLNESMEMAKQGMFVDADAVTENWNMVFGEGSPIMAALMSIPEMTPVIAESIIGVALGFDTLGMSATEAVDTLNATANAFAGSEAAAGKAQQSFDWLNASQKAATKQAELLLGQYKNEKLALENLEKASKTLEKGQAALNKAKKATGTLSDAEQNDLKAVGKLVGYQGENYDVLQNKIKQYGETMSSEISATITNLQGLEGELTEAAARSNVEGSVQVDCAGAVSELQGLLAKAQAVAAVLAALGLGGGGGGSGGGGGGGGGGGKKDDAAAEAERARKEALQRDYDLIAHKRHMNQITLEMELSMLQRIRREHKLTAEEIMAWEEKVYDVKQEIRARDAGSLDTIGDALITALTARYQAMLDAETERLDTSRRAWEDWRDGSVKAIQDQIDALDALAKTEDREKQDQEELRKIAKLRQDIEFEQDEYNRMKLSQQLEQAMESREERLRRLALEDAKDALRAEMEGIEERAEAELKALDEEQAAIEKAYAEQMKSAAIQAEAEKLLMANNQQELISLIGEYAPEYNALGKTLGEKLLDGFKQKTADVVRWFESLNSQLYAIQEAAAAEAIAASNALYAAHAQNQSAPATEVPAVTTVNQTVNFNEPVDSAGENARKLQRVNEELGAILNG